MCHGGITSAHAACPDDGSVPECSVRLSASFKHQPLARGGMWGIRVCVCVRAVTSIIAWAEELRTGILYLGACCKGPLPAATAAG